MEPFSSQDLGWARGYEVPPFMYHHGDNTDFGYESVLIYAKKIFDSYENKPIKVRCRAFWYDIKAEGSMTFTIKTYKGGEIVDSGTYLYACEGGIVIDEYSKQVNISTRTNDDVPGDDIGEFTINADGKISG